MSVSTLEALYITLLVIAPGWFSGMAMAWLTGLPSGGGPIEPVVRATIRSLLGLVVLEAAAWAWGDEFGWFILTPLLSGQIIDVGTLELAVRYGLLWLVVIVIPTSCRWTLQRSVIERLVGRRTQQEASLHRLRRYQPPSDDGAPLVRVVTTHGPVEGWLQWAADGTEDDQAVIVRAEGSLAVTWIPVASIVHYTVLDPTRRGVAATNTDPSGDE